MGKYYWHILESVIENVGELEEFNKNCRLLARLLALSFHTAISNKGSSDRHAHPDCSCICHTVHVL